MPDVDVQIVGQNQPTSSFSDGPSIDFGALKAQASEMLDKATGDAPEPDAPADAVVADDPATTRVKGATTTGQAEPAKADAPVAEPTALDLQDDQLVKVIVDGEEQILPWKEAKGVVSGGMKFTKSMQQLAADKKAFETDRNTLTQLQAERQKLDLILSNKALLENYMRATFGVPQQQPLADANASENPDEIATVGQARSIAERQAAAVVKQIEDAQKAIDQKIENAVGTIETRQQVAKHSIAINSVLADIFAKNPVLNAIPNAEDLIRFEVSKLNPQTEPEALTAFLQVGKALTDEIGKHYKANQKIQVVAAAKQKLESTKVEPAGGAAPQLAPTSFKDADGTVNWKKVQEAAKAML